MTTFGPEETDLRWEIPVQSGVPELGTRCHEIPFSYRRDYLCRGSTYVFSLSFSCICTKFCAEMGPTFSLTVCMLSENWSSLRLYPSGHTTWTRKVRKKTCNQIARFNIWLSNLTTFTRKPILPPADSTNWLLQNQTKNKKSLSSDSIRKPHISIQDLAKMQKWKWHFL
jgi:hypothetical protein